MRPLAFSRVVVALGASRECTARLTTWATLARRFEAELAGLFVEDMRLLHMAGFSFGVIGPDCVARPLDPTTMERLLHRAADDARAALETSASHQAIPCSFSKVRGDVAREIDANVAHDDLVIIEAGAFGAARPALERSHASVLYLDPQITAGRTVIVRASAADEALLVVSAHLAAATGRTLEVVVTNDRAGAEDEARALLDRTAPEHSPTRARVQRGGEERIRDLLRHDRGAIVVARPARERREDRPGDAPRPATGSLLIVRGLDEPANGHGA